MTPKSGSMPDPEELKRSLLERFEEKKKVIVGVGILVTVGIIGLVFYFSLGRQAANEDWYRLFNASQPMAPRSAELEELSEQGNRDLRAHALLQLANSSILRQDYDKAVSSLERLQSEFGDTTLARLASPDRRMPLPALILDHVKSNGEWEKKYGYDDDPKVDTSRVALVETDKGGFWIGFFPEYSPKHVDNFIAKAKAGAFNGTLFYQVSSTQTRFGGATTRDEDETNDANEAEDATYLEPEKGRYRIQHRRGMVSSVRTDKGESAEKVTIAFNWASDLNKRQTVFGKVLADRGAGMAHLDEIKNVETYATSKDPLHRDERFMDLPDHPIEPVRVLRISIWSDDKIEGGHAWDTSAVDAESADEKPKEEEKPAEDDKGEDAGEKSGDEGTEEKPAEVEKK